MACRLGACEINNNRPKAKKSTPKATKGKRLVVKSSSSDWSDSDDPCSGCSACWGSSSTCSCSECNMETDSSNDSCYSSACRPKEKKAVEKPRGNGKIWRCRDGVCELVPKKKVKKPVKPKKPTAKKPNEKVKKSNKKTPNKNRYECC